MTETCRAFPQMPFSDQRSLVTIGAQNLGNIRTIGFQRILQRIYSVAMAVLPGENSRPAGYGNRITAKTIIQHTTFPG